MITYYKTKTELTDFPEFCVAGSNSITAEITVPCLCRKESDADLICELLNVSESFKSITIGAKEASISIQGVSKGDPVNIYTENEIKKAFWAAFHKSGEAFFDYDRPESDCQNSTEAYWDDFLRELNNESN